MPNYQEVVRAARETAITILAGRVLGHIEMDTCGGETANVNYKQGIVYIKLPSLAGDVNLTRQEADRIVGLVAHECCHVLHTDFGVWRTPMASNVRNMLNWLEDVRIEAKELQAGTMPGLLDVFSTMETYDAFRCQENRRKTKAPPCGSLKIDFGAVVATLARVANGYTIPGANLLRPRVPAFAQPILDRALHDVHALRDTADAHRMAERVCHELDIAEAQQPPQQPPAQQPKTPSETEGEGTEGEGTEGEGTEGEGTEGEGTEGEGTEGEGSEGESSEGEGTEGEGTEGEGEAQQQAPPSNAPASWGKARGGKANEMTDRNRQSALMQEIKQREGVHADAQAQSPILTWNGCEQIPARDPDPTKGARLRGIVPAPGILRDQITRLIRSDERHGVERYRSTGRLDRRALTRCATGAQNVFARRTMAEGVDTAVLLLVDASTSMEALVGGCAGNKHIDRSDMALTLALHLAEAADAARGKVCIATFEGGGANARLRVLKPFEGALDVDVLAASRPSARTPLAAAILGAAEMLANEPASRRILLALTDGEDDLDRLGGCVRVAVSIAASRGIETVGIGCGLDVAYAFPASVFVEDLSRLPEEGLAALAGLLDPGNSD